MSSYSGFYRPALKNSVDVQLQTAFNEGQWSTVTRLAAQRYKMKKDPYYEVGPPVQSAICVRESARLTTENRQYASVPSRRWIQWPTNLQWSLPWTLL